MIKRIAAGLLILPVLFYAWPMWSCWQLRQAMKSRDVATLQSHVDWDELRRNLKPRISSAIREDADKSGAFAGALKRALSGAVAERAVEFTVTPQNLARLLAGREFVTRRFGGIESAPQPTPAPQAKGQPQPAPNPAVEDVEDPEDPMPPRRLRYAFFESFDRFRVEATHPRVPGGRVVAMLAQRGLGWKLVDVDIIASR